ncbi:glycosyltransferase family 4 protein [Pendulispora brunnea]|uniref:Glycosyltransferase family 4 protein n=1 Tax=Pendulispora brunnea TaxID=2905690 RepID=A0ABZ2KLR5_9BACT
MARLEGRKVRVLFINDTARNGGPGRSLFYILKFLDPKVVHRAVVLPRPGVIGELYEKGGVVDDLFFEQNLVENPIEPWNRPMQREDFDAALPLKGVRLAGNVVRGARAIARLSALARRGRFDLLYCNGTNADFAGGALARTSGVPALWHVRYTSLPSAVAPLHDRLAASRGVRRIVCVSKAAASLFPHCPEKVSVIHNALDVEEFNASRVTPALRAELGLGPDVIVFGSQGRILRRKGYIEMVRAAGIALKDLSDAEKERVRFVIIGDTPQDFRPDHLAECRELAESLGIQKWVHFAGFRADVKPYVADFDVAVVPSVYPDPLPRAVIESMAMGKPVIAFDVGGVAEMLADGITGTLVRLPRERDVQGSGRDDDSGVRGLAAEFVRYMRDPGLRAEQGKLARARIEREFSGERQAKKIQNEILLAAGFGESIENLEASP